MKQAVLSKSLHRCQKHRFLFEELVKRDFKQKYKRTVLGMGWSLLAPLLTLFVMQLVFGRFFGRMEHYTIYLFCGNLLFSYFKEATNGGMNSLIGNAGIFTKVNVPKYLFLLSKNVSALINFGLTLVIFFIFVYFDGIKFSLGFILLLYPIVCLVIFNLGFGMILSALFVFFRDIKYLYDVFTLMLMYCSAIFYTVPKRYMMYFMMNPVYTYIRYFRIVVLEGKIPSQEHHLLCAFYAFLVLGIGCWMYKKYNHKFLYYV